MRSISTTTSVCEQCGELIPAKVITDGVDVYLHKFCRRHGESQARIYCDVAQYLRAQRFVKPAWKPQTFAGVVKNGCPNDCGFCERHEQHLCMPIIEITTRCDLACPVCINSSGAPTAVPSSEFRVPSPEQPVPSSEFRVPSCEQPVPSSEPQLLLPDPRPLIPDPCSLTPDPRPLTPALWDMSLDEFRFILDRLLEAERQVDVLNLSGGEPLLHPRFLDLLDEALARTKIVRTSVSTNGMAFLTRPELLRELRDRNVVVSLQFDGFSERAYQILRGRALLDEKRRILDMLCEAGATTSLTMTAAAGVNDDQFPAMLDCLFGRDNIVSMMIQPLAFAGRAADLAGAIPRLTIPEVVRLLAGAGRPAVKENNFVPLPCSNPLCISLAFYLMLESGQAVSLNELANADVLMDSISNRVFFGLEPDEYEKLKQMIYDLWSGPSGAAPDGREVLATLRNLLKQISCCGGFDPRQAFQMMERKVKSIFIHAFQDAQTFDLARVRRCCQAYPQPDGRLIPACVRNVIKRKADE
ncbi:MAG: radical SAM protein [Candidatus Sumerlaeota bacterium]|nr:radical SAM protein [Candidatus Sumerlaeota bacterium]